MRLETKRCQIREFREEDIGALMAYHNNLSWMKYQGFKGLTFADYQQILLNSQTTIADGLQFAIENRETQELVGDLYLKQDATAFWLGYTIAPQFARQGYATEAVTGLLQWLQTKKQARLIKADVEVGNVASAKLLEKLGFQYLGLVDNLLNYELEFSD